MRFGYFCCLPHEEPCNKHEMLAYLVSLGITVDVWLASVRPQRVAFDSPDPEARKAQYLVRQPWTNELRFPMEFMIPYSVASVEHIIVPVRIRQAKLRRLCPAGGRHASQRNFPSRWAPIQSGS